MKWVYSIQRKFKAAFLLASICSIVLLTNLWNRYQMSELGNSFSSVIRDRLHVESYIFMIADQLHLKKLTINACNYSEDSTTLIKVCCHNDSINYLFGLYDKTLLTQKEAIYLNELKKNVHLIQELGLSYLSLAKEERQKDNILSKFNQHFNNAFANLFELSQIQIKEGELLNKQSQHVVNKSYFITNFELVLLIYIALLIQFIIFVSRPIKLKFWQHYNLN